MCLRNPLVGKNVFVVLDAQYDFIPFHGLQHTDQFSPPFKGLLQAHGDLFSDTFLELRQLKSRRSMPGLDTSRVNFPGTKSSTSRSAPRRRLTASQSSMLTPSVRSINTRSRGWRPGFMSSMPQSRHPSAAIAGENRVFKASTPKRLLVLCSGTPAPLAPETKMGTRPISVMPSVAAGTEALTTSL